MGFARSPDELGGLSAQLADYFRIATGAWTWGRRARVRLRRAPVVPRVRRAAVCRDRRAAPWVAATPESDSRHLGPDAIGAYLLTAMLAVWLSMGPGPGRPYGLLFHLVPGLNGLRVPARLSAVVIVALAVLAGAGFAWLLERLNARAAAAVAVAIGAIIALEGQHGIGVSDAVSWNDKSWDRVAYEWLRESPPGAAIELNITQQDDFHPFTMIYQFNTLWHRHPIVNGYSGWKSMLQELLGGPASPLREPEQVPQTLRGLRAIGVRYVLLHEQTFADQLEAGRIVSAIRSASDQIAEEHQWPETWAWRLTDADPRPAAADGDLRRLDPKTFEVHASHQEGRLPFLFDDDIDTRWMTGARSGGRRVDYHSARPAGRHRSRADRLVASRARTTTRAG